MQGKVVRSWSQTPFGEGSGWRRRQRRGGGLNMPIIVWLDKSSDICELCLFPTIEPDLNRDFLKLGVLHVTEYL